MATIILKNNYIKNHQKFSSVLFHITISIINIIILCIFYMTRPSCHGTHMLVHPKQMSQKRATRSDRRGVIVDAANARYFLFAK